MAADIIIVHTSGSQEPEVLRGPDELAVVRSIPIIVGSPKDFLNPNDLLNPQMFLLDVLF